MPANFTNEERAILIEKFYTIGYELLKKYGYKKLKIKDISVSVGIGTGTFYNFFNSKDEFIIWLIKKRKETSYKEFEKLSIEFPNGIPREKFENFLFETISKYNIYRCLSQDDFDILEKKYALLDKRANKIKESGKFILNKLATNKTLTDYELFAESFTIIIIGTSDLNKLNSNFTDTVIKKFIQSACDFLY